MNHGAPITSVLLLPGGGSLLTAGSNVIKLWDVLGGGRLVHSFSAHQKLITGMTLDGTGSRLLSCGLDSLVKVYEVGSYATLATLRYDAGLVALAVSPDNTRLVAGTTTGALSIKSRLLKVAEVVSESRSTRALRGGTYKYYLRGQRAQQSGQGGTGVVEEGKQKLQPYDAALKNFLYGESLDAALATGSPVVVVGLLEELVQRGGLGPAITGRGEATLTPLLTFLLRHVTDPRYSPLLLDLSAALLDAYGPTMARSPLLATMFGRIRAKLVEEAKLSRDLLQLQGTLDALLAAAGGR